MIYLLLISSAMKCISDGVGCPEYFIFLLKIRRCLRKGLLLVDPEGDRLTRRSDKRLFDGSRQLEGLRAKDISWKPRNGFIVM